MHRQAGVDDLLDQDDVAALDVAVEILQEPHLLVAARLVRVVPGQLDEVDRVEDAERARQVGDERDAGLERADEQRLPAVVVAGQLGAQLPDAGVELETGEEDLPDAFVGRAQDACRRPDCPRRPNCRERRWKSRS